jgi:hypothetical protein
MFFDKMFVSIDSFHNPFFYDDFNTLRVKFEVNLIEYMYVKAYVKDEDE